MSTSVMDKEDFLSDLEERIKVQKEKLNELRGTNSVLEGLHCVTGAYKAGIMIFSEFDAIMSRAAANNSDNKDIISCIDTQRVIAKHLKRNY